MRRAPPDDGASGRDGDDACFHLVLVQVPDGPRCSCGEGCDADLAAGELFLARPGERLRGLLDGVSTCWTVAFHADAVTADWSDTDVFAPRVVDELMLASFSHDPAPARRYRVSRAEWPRWEFCLTSLERELTAGQVGAGAAARALLELLLVHAARAARAAVTVPSGLPASAPPIVVAVFQCIGRRYRTPIGLADVAKSVGRSPSYLTDLVRRETGRTVLQWIIERRMAEARRLLLETDLHIKDVGPRIGYDDAGHFIRQFHRLHGATPQHWRMGHRQGPPDPWATDRWSMAGPPSSAPPPSAPAPSVRLAAPTARRDDAGVTGGSQAAATGGDAPDVTRRRRRD